ncbi:hypothetical protein E2C01_038382 [Portunus trituberculatus]|uniref:Uncharacterized protein n=1 Tax=Portunus trituberculatus TaxID=210409 RepID=A0A5B7FHU6_PORTR|nr:hypothetical protein [Portunus trituberculatus]
MMVFNYICSLEETKFNSCILSLWLGRRASLHLLSPVPLSQLQSLAPLLPGLSCCGRPEGQAAPARTASPPRVLQGDNLDLMLTKDPQFGGC